jgi:hypothetical protein
LWTPNNNALNELFTISYNFESVYICITAIKANQELQSRIHCEVCS